MDSMSRFAIAVFRHSGRLRKRALSTRWLVVIAWLLNLLPSPAVWEMRYGFGPKIERQSATGIPGHTPVLKNQMMRKTKKTSLRGEGSAGSSASFFLLTMRQSLIMTTAMSSIAARKTASFVVYSL